MPNAVFASHASHERNRYMIKFFKAFHESLRAALGARDKETINELVFWDAECLSLGVEWTPALLEALVTARTFICLISPTYVQSDWCGRELTVACDRFDEWKKTATNAAQGRFIFPLIWNIEVLESELDPQIARLQYRSKRYPKAYDRGGLSQLSKLGKNRDDFILFVDALAHEVSSVLKKNAELELPAAKGIKNFEQIVSAFVPKPRPYDMLYWSPVEKSGVFPAAPDAKSLKGILGLLANSMQIVIRPFLPKSDALKTLTLAKENLQIVLIITEFDTPLDDVMKQAGALTTLDNLALIVIDRTAGQGTSARPIQTWLQNHTSFPAFGLLAKADRAVTCLQADLWKEIEMLRARARISMIENAPSGKAEDAVLAKKAAAEGISTDTKPDLRGPGSKTEGAS